MIDEIKVLRKRVIISPLWIMPIAAAIISIWMIVNGHLNSGEDIQIEFDSSVGLVAGKTSLVYRGMEVGKVTDIAISESRPDRVTVTARLKKGAEELAKEGASFWIVRPRIGIQEISNLETILTGAYISVKPPSLDINNLLRLPKRNKFFGRSNPPGDDPCSDCTIIQFTAESKGNLKEGSGIFYRDFKIGKISSIELNYKDQHVLFKALIDPSFNDLLQFPIYLWRQQALQFDMSSKSFNLDVAPISSILEGRLELGVFQHGKPNHQEVLTLYRNEASAKKEHLRKAGGKVINFVLQDNSNIKEGSPITYKQIRIGELEQFRLAKDGVNIAIQGLIYPGFTHLLNKRSYFHGSASVHLDTKNFDFTLAQPEQLLNGGIELSHAASDIEENKNTSTFQIFNSNAQAVNFLKEQRAGIRILLLANKKRSIEVGSPVLYRQIAVGDVEWIKLDAAGKQVHMGIFIEKEYQHLVRTGSKFWNASGIQASLSLSGGMKVQTDSLRSLVNGGISFNTPNSDQSGKAKGGESFSLHEKAEEKWLD